MPSKRSHAETVSEDYYDSSDADRFYETVWGGEDIHIGLYDAGDSISEASRKTVAAMASRLRGISASAQVIDLGAGYGGSARYLAKEYGAHVTCLNISAVQNERNRMLNRRHDLEGLVSVRHGSFESIPCDDQSMHIAWSQDAFLHSSNRDKIIAEIDRVLKPGGEIIFTDPMQADDCPSGVLQPVYDRLNLDSLASFSYYREAFARHGFAELSVTDLTPQLRTHYARVRLDLKARYEDLARSITTAYMDAMIIGLKNWVEAADTGYLAWGILHFRKGQKGRTKS